MDNLAKLLEQEDPCLAALVKRGGPLSMYEHQSYLKALYPHSKVSIIGEHDRWGLFHKITVERPLNADELLNYANELRAMDVHPLVAEQLVNLKRVTLPPAVDLKSFDINNWNGHFIINFNAIPYQDDQFICRYLCQKYGLLGKLYQVIDGLNISREFKGQLEGFNINKPDSHLELLEQLQNECLDSFSAVLCYLGTKE